MRDRVISSSVLWRLALGAALLSVMASCSVTRLISDYDEPTDNALTNLQQKVDDFIVGLDKVTGSAEAAFDNHQQFYEAVDRDLRQLEFRVDSIPQNTQTQELVRSIREVVLGNGTCDETGTSLRDLHCMPANRARGPSQSALDISRRNINQTVSAALSLELAKKQGLQRNAE